MCRKSNPAEIKIVKFSDLKRDLTEDVLKEDFYKQITQKQLEKKDRDSQAVVHHIDKIDDTIMDMVVSACGNFLILNF
jgi:hypothetical protein